MEEHRTLDRILREHLILSLARASRDGTEMESEIALAFLCVIISMKVLSPSNRQKILQVAKGSFSGVVDVRSKTMAIGE